MKDYILKWIDEHTGYAEDAIDVSATDSIAPYEGVVSAEQLKEFISTLDFII